MTDINDEQFVTIPEPTVSGAMHCDVLAALNQCGVDLAHAQNMLPQVEIERYSWDRNYWLKMCIPYTSIVYGDKESIIKYALDRVRAELSAGIPWGDK